LYFVQLVLAYRDKKVVVSLAVFRAPSSDTWMWTWESTDLPDLMQIMFSALAHGYKTLVLPAFQMKRQCKDLRRI
jgi:hypothetical protein